jgi:sigma-B regulation protein RsbU (phosphoserine phosphatase)
MKQARILVVDDEPGMLRVVQRILGARYEIETVDSATDAIGVAAEYRPDLAILDIRMPEMDGFELMGRLKKDHPDLDVILMTGSAGEPDLKLIRAIREKAFYFIQKPFDREVLETLVARWLEIRRLSEDNRRHLQRLERQLAEARAFQQSLLPAPEARIGDVAICSRYVPCEDLGGDYCDHAPAGDGRAALIMADVSGHGVSAAMLTGIVRSAFHACQAVGYEPLAVVEKIAEGMAAFPSHRFVSLICALLDTKQGRLTYVNAGHPPGFLWGETDRSGEGGLVRLEATGMFISPGLPPVTRERSSLPMEPNDRLLLYTDGIPEAQSEESFFGEERITAEIARFHSGGARLLDGILESVRTHCGGRPQTDDLTLMTARIRSGV